MLPITHCLNKQLLEICQQAFNLEDLNRKINVLLPSNLINACTVGSYKKGCLVLVLKNPSFATELRYCLPSLRDNLRKDGGLHQLVSIKMEIMADLYPKNKDDEKSLSLKPQISAKAEQSIKEIMQRLKS